jgi:hypothetical protein
MTKTNIFWGKKGQNIVHGSRKNLDSTMTARLQNQNVTTRADLISSTHRTITHMPSLGKNLKGNDLIDIFDEKPGQYGSWNPNLIENECASIREVVDRPEISMG